jgi:hypothetical protein
MHRHLVPKFLGVVVLLTALGGGAAYAFTASNSVPASYAGQGTSLVSGYTVYNIDYGTCNSGAAPCLTYLTSSGVGDAQDSINSVSFQLSPDNAQFVSVQVWDTTGTVLLGGGHNSCSETAAGSPPPDGLGASTPWIATLGIWTCTNLDDISGETITTANIGAVDVQAVQ